MGGTPPVRLFEGLAALLTPIILTRRCRPIMASNNALHGLALCAGVNIGSISAGFADLFARVARSVEVIFASSALHNYMA
jgi:hypothetical protein